MESSDPEGPWMTLAPPDARRQSPNPMPVMLAATAALMFAGGIVAALLHSTTALSLGLRLVAIALLVPVALTRRSLLVWTFFAILAGAELGADAPGVALQTHLLGEIFLRLIRMIVAPLIFGGIVAQYAGK